MTNNNTHHDFRISNARYLMLTKQLNPHFINNFLNSIQNNILINNIESTIKIIPYFAKYLNYILEFSNLNLINIKEEINFLNTYFELQKFRLKDKLNIELKINKDIESCIDKYKLPPFILKSFIENSIENGILKKEGIGNLIVEINLINNKLQIIIDDDGIGLIKGSTLNEWKDSNKELQSLSIIKEKLMIEYKIEDKIHLNNNLSGTIAMINFDLY